MGPEPRFHSLPDEFPLEEVVSVVNSKQGSQATQQGLSTFSAPNLVFQQFEKLPGLNPRCADLEDKREFTLLLSVHLKAFVLKFLILQFWAFTVRRKF